MDPILIVNKKTTKPIIDQLIKKYPCLKQKRGFLRDSIKMLLCDWCSICLDPNTRLYYLAESILSNLGYESEDQDDILSDKDIVQGYSEKYFKNQYEEQHILNTFCDNNKITNFKTIVWASHFYGKSIDDLIDDASNMRNYHHRIFGQIWHKGEVFLMFVHIIKCDILTMLGFLFFILKIAMILDCYDIKEVNTIHKSIIASIKENKIYVNEKIGKDKINIIYQMYQSIHADKSEQLKPDTDLYHIYDCMTIKLMKQEIAEQKTSVMDHLKVNIVKMNTNRYICQ